MTDCPAPGSLVEARLDRVLTQYRESPKLLHLIRTYLGQVEGVVSSVCQIPSFFDLDTAVGDQLTLLGKRLGFPRCHCVCATQPVFGFDCDGVSETTVYTVTGFCDENASWLDCGPFDSPDICIDDDEIYRNFLRARRYQMLALYDLDSLTDAIQYLFGPTAYVMDAGVGRVVIAPGRALSAVETALLQLYPRVLPVAPGIRVRFHFGIHREVFGFGDGWGGFCDTPGETDHELAVTDDEVLLVTIDGVEETLMVGPQITLDAEWMCEVDVRPFDCAA